MNRIVTNAIRFVMDELIPPIVRDNRYFMWPFYYVWFKGENIRQVMEFKSKVYNMSPEDMIEFYKNRDSLAKDRLTDLSQKSLKIMLKHIDPQTETLLDVGCGNGYFLEYIHQKGIQGCSCDVFETVDFPHAHYVKGNIECLPFEDGQFDIVASYHTLEHVIDIGNAIAELKRVAKNQVFVVVPRQRYYYYTLDEHVHFFPDKETLEHRMNMKYFHCEKFKAI